MIIPTFYCYLNSYQTVKNIDLNPLKSHLYFPFNLKTGRTKRVYFDNMQKIADALDVSLDEFR